MAEIIVQPFLISYNGKDANQHIIHAQQLGESIIGAAKLYTAVAHYCTFGTIPRGNYKKEFYCYAKPPSEGSFEYQLLVGAIAHEWALHGEIYKEGLSFLFSHIVNAIKKIWLKPAESTQVAIELAETLREFGRGNNAVTMVLANGLVQSNVTFARLQERLILKLPDVADSTRSHGRSLVRPVGDTCSSLTQFAHTKQEITISEPEADVIRGGTDMEIDDMQEFRCKRITEVNVESGHCILDVEGFNALVTGKISDPALETPNNIYTRSLNGHTPFIISAKPVKRNGIVQKLHISDAREISEPSSLTKVS
ncbi:DUF7946 domain-containing protein [Nitrosospira briensis]|uniref:DUF7946 domain-containing protein n=1 Tax=Nitrosospira briensis TaxID=35799 RepID=UPI000468F722|nr:hypothetical protein [Nitrosospira briensis]